MRPAARRSGGHPRITLITLPSLDPHAESIIGFLRDAGAAELRHSGAGTLLDHLAGTYAILRRWHQPQWLTHAGLLHSVYGTLAFREELLPVSRRRELAELAGEEAEGLAFAFGKTPLASLRQASPSDERDALLMIHMANLADQARAEDASPGRWLARLAELAELLITSDTVSLPLFIAGLAAFTDAEEALTRRAYRDGNACRARARGPGEPAGPRRRHLRRGGGAVRLAGSSGTGTRRSRRRPPLGRTRAPAPDRARDHMGQAAELRGVDRAGGGARALRPAGPAGGTAASPRPARGGAPRRRGTPARRRPSQTRSRKRALSPLCRVAGAERRRAARRDLSGSPRSALARSPRVPARRLPRVPLRRDPGGDPGSRPLALSP